MSFTALLDNRTPFAAQRFVLPDNEGQERTVAVVAATFVIDANGRATIASQPGEVRAADVHYADPVSSSLRYEAEVAWEKPVVDVLVNGSAYAPGGRAAEMMHVGLRIGGLEKTLLVVGDREWRRTVVGRAPGTPRPFHCMPLVWERAFGGTFDNKSELRNPVGVGFAGNALPHGEIMTELPNVEYANDRLHASGDRVRPAGFGIVGRGWQPRLAHAGTFDAKWLNEHWPFLPRDFDTRHFQAAPLDQQSPHLRGGELVTLFQLTPEGVWRFRLPTLCTPIHCFFDDRYEVHEPRLDTVLIEPNERRVRLTARLSIVTDRARGTLRALVVGKMSNGWIRARAQRKAYLDTRCCDGALPQAVYAELHG